MNVTTSTTPTSTTTTPATTARPMSHRYSEIRNLSIRHERSTREAIRHGRSNAMTGTELSPTIFREHVTQELRQTHEALSHHLENSTPSFHRTLTTRSVQTSASLEEFSTSPTISQRRRTTFTLNLSSHYHSTVETTTPTPDFQDNKSILRRLINATPPNPLNPAPQQVSSTPSSTKTFIVNESFYVGLTGYNNDFQLFPTQPIADNKGGIGEASAQKISALILQHLAAERLSDAYCNALTPVRLQELSRQLNNGISSLSTSETEEALRTVQLHERVCHLLNQMAPEDRETKRLVQLSMNSLETEKPEIIYSVLRARQTSIQYLLREKNQPVSTQFLKQLYYSAGLHPTTHRIPTEILIYDLHDTPFLTVLLGYCYCYPTPDTQHSTNPTIRSLLDCAGCIVDRPTPKEQRLIFRTQISMVDDVITLADFTYHNKKEKLVMCETCLKHYYKEIKEAVKIRDQGKKRTAILLIAFTLCRQLYFLRIANQGNKLVLLHVLLEHLLMERGYCLNIKGEELDKLLFASQEEIANKLGEALQETINPEQLLSLPSKYRPEAEKFRDYIIHKQYDEQNILINNDLSLLNKPVLGYSQPLPMLAILHKNKALLYHCLISKKVTDDTDYCLKLLRCACINGANHCLDLLLQCKTFTSSIAKLKKDERMGDILLATVNANNHAGVEKLIAVNFPVNAPNSVDIDGCSSALLLAVKQNKNNIAGMLYKAKANLNVRDDLDYCPFCYCCLYNDLELLFTFRNCSFFYGQMVKCNVNGISPLNIARQQDQKTIHYEILAIPPEERTPMSDSDKNFALTLETTV